MVGLPVLDADVARMAGVVADVLVDPLAGRLVAIDVQHGDGFLKHRAPAESLVRIDHSRVVVAGSSDLEFAPPQAWNPEIVPFRKLVGLHVLTEHGERVGRLRDAHLNVHTLSVEVFLLTSLPLVSWLRRARVYRDDILSFGPEAMVLRVHPARRNVVVGAARPAAERQA
jgi:uncharacterized protein YrrD